jgi:hypothetical protein
MYDEMWQVTQNGHPRYILFLTSNTVPCALCSPEWNVSHPRCSLFMYIVLFKRLGKSETRNAKQ